MKARLAVPLVALALAGCNQQGTTDEQPTPDEQVTSDRQQVKVDEEEVEQEVSSQLEKLVGQAPDRIDCPDDLEGEEGAEMRCVLYAGRDRLGVTLTVTRVNGDNVAFDIKVDEKMMK